MKAYTLLCYLFLYSLINLPCNAQIKLGNNIMLDKWEASSNLSIDSMIYDGIADSDYVFTKHFFCKYVRGLRIMAINELVVKTNNNLFEKTDSDKIYLIELKSNGYCSTYDLYLLCNNGVNYSFRAECASRQVMKTKNINYCFDKLDGFILGFKEHGDYMYGETCMITSITNGVFKSYPLLYLNSEELLILKSFFPKKWRKLK